MLVNQITPITAGDIRRHGYKTSFDRHLGIATESIMADKQRAVVKATPQETALNPHGCVHGGWTATLLDTVAGGVAYTNQTGGLEDSEYGLTKTLNIKFNAPVFAGQSYTCEGRIDRREGNNIHTTATITDDSDTQVASATALIKARRPDYGSVRAM